MLDNKYDITQWEEWNNPPLPISAENAWKAMEKLLDEESSDIIPVPVLLVENEKGKRKRFAFWWIVLVGIGLLGTVLVSKQKVTTNTNHLSIPQNNKTSNQENHSPKHLITTGKKIAVDADSKVTNATQVTNTTSVKSVINKATLPSDTVNTIKSKLTSRAINQKEQKEHNIAVSNRIVNASSTNTTPVYKDEQPSNNDMAGTVIMAPKINTSQAKGKYTIGMKSINRSTKKLLTTNEIDKTNKGIVLFNEKADNRPIKYTKSSNKAIDNEPKRIPETQKNNSCQMDSISATRVDDSISRNISITTTKPDSLVVDSNKIAVTKDSSKTKKANKPIEKLILWRLSAGLQWSASLPMTDNNSNTTKQLIPGVWLYKNWGSKSTVSLSVNPFVMQTNSRFTIENKIQSIGALASTIKLDTGWYSFDTATSQFKIDTSIKVNRIATLLQSFGYRIVVDYKYQFAKKWQVSFGVEYNKIVSAYINDKIIRVFDGLVAKDSNADVKTGNDLWNLIQHSYFSGNVAITYNPLDKLSISLGLHKPFKSIANDKSQSISPSSYFLNLRWKLWQSKE